MPTFCHAISFGEAVQGAARLAGSPSGLSTCAVLAFFYACDSAKVKIMNTQTSSTVTAAATTPSIDSLWRGRAISQKESQWIAGQRSDIEDAASSIHGLADMLTAVIELVLLRHI